MILVCQCLSEFLIIGILWFVTLLWFFTHCVCSAHCRGGVTALQYSGSLTLGVGSSTGHVMLYDLRSTHPYQTRDHHYSTPVHTIAFQHNEQHLVLSADKKALRIWNQHTVSEREDLFILCCVCVCVCVCV